MEEDNDNDKGVGVTPSPPEVLGGVQAIRPNLVELAVKFLGNPKVWERPMEDKRAFLMKKGQFCKSLCVGTSFLYCLQV